MTFLALIIAQTRPHIRYACKALNRGVKEQGIAEISIENLMDSDRYYALLFLKNGPTWKIEFVPQGWHPVAGKIDVDMFYLPSVEWPVLIIGKNGVFHPRYKPVHFKKP